MKKWLRVLCLASLFAVCGKPEFRAINRQIFAAYGFDLCVGITNSINKTVALRRKPTVGVL